MKYATSEQMQALLPELEEGLSTPVRLDALELVIPALKNHNIPPKLVTEVYNFRSMSLGPEGKRLMELHLEGEMFSVIVHYDSNQWMSRIRWAFDNTSDRSRIFPRVKKKGQKKKNK